MSGPSFPSFGSARAVLIGAASYTSRDLTPIPHSARNIRGLEAALTDGALGGFARDDVRLVDDPDKAQDIMEPVRTAAEEAEDVLLVYYSGHGLIAGATGDLHLSMTESEPGQDWTSLRFSYLAGVVKQSRADVKIVILDSCFSGLAHSDLMGAESRLITDQLAAVRGVYSLTSAPGDRRSKAPAGARYSAFTGFLLGAMQEGVQGAGPLLGANDLYNEVLRRMRDTSLPLPEECGKTGAGDFPLVRNRAFPPPAPKPEPVPEPIPVPVPRERAVPAAGGVPVPRATTPAGGPAFATVQSAGYRIGDVNARLAKVIATVASPDQWSQAAPPYFRTESGRKYHGYDVAEVNAYIERHRHEPTTFADALRLVLMLQGFILERGTGRPGWLASVRRKRFGMADGEQLVGRATNSARRTIAFTDTHLCVSDPPDLLRIPYSRLEDLSLSVSWHQERVVTVTDQAGLCEDVLIVVTALRFGHHEVRISEGSNHPLLSALRRFLAAMADLRERHPEWFARP